MHFHACERVQGRNHLLLALRLAITKMPDKFTVLLLQVRRAANPDFGVLYYFDYGQIWCRL